MRNKELVWLEERLLHDLPGFVIKGPLMLVAPIQHAVRGFYFDRSDFGKGFFYVTSFFMPLCVPTDHLHFTFGNRLRHRGADRWDVGQNDLETTLKSTMLLEAPRLVKLQTPGDVAHALEGLIAPNRNNYVNPHSLEAYGYMLIKAGKMSIALKTIEALLGRINSDVSWEQEIALRARLIGALLREHPPTALSQLATWESETILHLELEQFF